MRLSLLTYIFLSVAIFAGVLSILLGNVSLLAIVAGCIVIPSIGIITLLDRMKSDIAGISFKREVSAAHMRQNSEIIVSSTILPADSRYQFEDIIPAGTQCVSGSTVFNQGIASYVLRVSVAGTCSFGGILVTLSSLFGTFTIRLSDVGNAELVVYPTGTAAEIQKNVDVSENASDSFPLVHSTEVQDFREYHPGDSLRDIDWKQTLKWDKLYIRVKQNIEFATPFVIFDLPDSSTSADDVAVFLKTVQDVIIYAGKFDDAVMVVFICGGNIIATFSIADTANIFQHLNHAGSIDRATELYRERSKLELQRLHDMIQSSDTYTMTLRRILAKTANRAEIGFEAQAKRLIASCAYDVEHVIIVSSGLGDISHLRYLINDAAQYVDTVTVNITTAQRHLVDEFIRIGATSVEVCG